MVDVELVVEFDNDLTTVDFDGNKDGGREEEEGDFFFCGNFGGFSFSGDFLVSLAMAALFSVSFTICSIISVSLSLSVSFLSLLFTYKLKHNI